MHFVQAIRQRADRRCPLSYPQLCAMHELDGHRFCRYHELGQYIFGERRCEVPARNLS